MTYATSLQSLNGAHTAGGIINNGQCGVDWNRDRVFIGSASGSLVRLGITSGLEQAYISHTVYSDAYMPPVGVDSDGNVHLSLATSLYAGGTRELSGDTLAALTTSAAYPNPHFGGAGMSAIKVGARQFLIDSCGGSTIIGSLNNTSFSKGGIYLSSLSWPNGNALGFNCAGMAGSNTGFVITSPGSAGSTQIATLHKVTFGIGATVSVIKAYVPSDLDGAWTGIVGWGICVDAYDGNPLIVFGGNPGESVRLAKVHRNTGAVIWSTVVSGIMYQCGHQFSQSRVNAQRIMLFGTGPNSITVINTADGSTVTSFTAGLAGITFQGPQCSDDVTGAIICNLSFTSTTGSPTRLRATPSSYNGWFAIYVADAMTPLVGEAVPGDDEVSPYVPPIIIPPVRQLRLFPEPPWKEYQCGSNPVSVFPVPFHVIEQADLQVEVNGTKLTQSDLTYTGRDSVMAGHDTGYVTLNVAASNCIVRIWADRTPARTDDHADGEFDKVDANLDLEKLWVVDRCQRLKQQRSTDDPATGTVPLQAAYAGIRQSLQGTCAATRAGSDLIYLGTSSGTVLTGTGSASLAELVCVKKGIWVVRTKSGSWSVA